MKAAVLHGPGRIVVENVPVPTLGPGEALVAVRAAGICGSDVPRMKRAEIPRLPLVLGHEFAGEVVRVSEGAGPVNPGDRVVVIPLIPCGRCDLCQAGEFAMCENYDYLGSRRDGGFAQYVRVPAQNLVRIPDELEFEAAAMTEPAAVALHGLRRTGVWPGDRVAVFGSGPIGLLAGQWARILGALEVFLVDTVPEKLELAVRLGFAPDHCIDASREDPVEAIRAATGGKGASLTVEAAGVAETVCGAIEAASRGGRVLLLGVPHEDVVLSPPVVGRILRYQLAIYGAWNSDFTNHPVNEWRLALALMVKGTLKVRPLISHRFSLDRFEDAFDLVVHRREVFHRVLIVPG